MRAVWYERQGPAREVLQVGERPTPVPGPGEVRVRLHASAVNPADANRRAGRGHAMEFPLVIPNSDGAGVIDMVGPGVTARRVGERVWLYFGQRGRAYGTAAEWICLDEHLTLPLPAHMSFAEGACLGIPGMTAEIAVLGDGPVIGRTILVTGGAGAVGHYAVQIAKWAGATVIATVSTIGKASHAGRAGADEVIDYRAGNVAERILEATEGRGVDRIVDVDLGSNLDLGLRVAAENAVWVSYATGRTPMPSLPVGQLLRKCLTIRGIYIPGLTPDERRRSQLGVQRFITEVPDALHTVDSVHPLAETAAAHEKVESGTKLGTVVVDCTA